MQTDLGERSVREHGAGWPHDDSHHVVAAFALLLFERGVRTTDQLSTRLTQLHVVRGRVEPASLAGLIDDLESTGLIAARPETRDEYELTAAGISVVTDWVAIMRDRWHHARAFLGLYDRTDE